MFKLSDLLVDRIDLLITAEDAVLQVSGLSLDFAEGAVRRFEALLFLGEFQTDVGESFALLIAQLAGTDNGSFKISPTLPFVLEVLLGSG